MDIKSGMIYPSYNAGLKKIVDQLKAVGVEEKAAREQAAARLVTGPKPTLRKLQKMIRRQIAQEHAQRKKGG